MYLSSNTSPENLYKDGLQRDQFYLLLKLCKIISIYSNFKGNLDFRKKDITQIDRFSPNNSANQFKINQIFHTITKIEKN